MKIVIAPDKFKDCLSATEVARAISAGLRDVEPDVVLDECPMADGGEGTVEALVAATGGRIVTRKVSGPLPGMKVDAPIGLLGDGFTAVVEMASASGLHLLREDQRDPMRTTSYGTGELLAAAAELGMKKIILGIGGSATIDGGLGAAQAWGAKFVLKTGQTYTAGDRKLTGGDLSMILRIDSGATPLGRKGRLRTRALDKVARALPPPPFADAMPSARPAHGQSAGLLDTRGVEMVVACDVGNPLLGDNGAAAVFGPQKGATEAQVRDLDAGLGHFAERIGRLAFADAPGAGAAGGLGFGMMAMFGATICSGAEIVMAATRLQERLKGADLCITGEGRFDAQSLAGKTPVSVANLCRELSVPCIVLAGTIGEGAELTLREGVSAYLSICDGPMPLADAIQQAPRLLQTAAATILRLRRRH
jgi:glycerate kinase